MRMTLLNSASTTSVLSVVGLLLLLQALVVTVQGALAPGYEDHYWCPSSSYCVRPINPGPSFAGPQSAFQDCYDPLTETSVEGAFTGALSDTDIPEGWVLDPGACTRNEVVPSGACPGRTEVIVVSDPCDVVSDVICNGAYQCSAARKWVRVTVDKAASSDATTVAAADILVANTVEEASAAVVGTTTRAAAAAAMSLVAAAAVAFVV